MIFWLHYCYILHHYGKGDVQMVSFPLINAWIYNIFSHSNLCGCRNQGNIYYATLIIRVPRGLAIYNPANIKSA